MANRPCQNCGSTTWWWSDGPECSACSRDADGILKHSGMTVRSRVVALLTGMVVFGMVMPRVTARVVPAVVFVGGTVRVTCRVPRDPGNRGLTFGLAGYRSTFDQLDGDAATVTHEIDLQHIPCEAGDAFCSLVDARGQVTRALATLEVAGCSTTRPTAGSPEPAIVP